MQALLNDQITPSPNMSHFSTKKMYTDAHIIHHLFACNRRLVHFLLIGTQSIEITVVTSSVIIYHYHLFTL